jgi:hypothetical protein
VLSDPVSCGRETGRRWSTGGGVHGSPLCTVRRWALLHQVRRRAPFPPKRGSPPANPRVSQARHASDLSNSSQGRPRPLTIPWERAYLAREGTRVITSHLTRVGVGFPEVRKLLPFCSGPARGQLLPFCSGFQVITFTVLHFGPIFASGALRAPPRPPHSTQCAPVHDHVLSTVCQTVPHRPHTLFAPLLVWRHAYAYACAHHVMSIIIPSCRSAQPPAHGPSR